MKDRQDLEVIKYEKTADIVSDVKSIIDSAQKRAFQSVNAVLVMRNWFLGKRIVEEELSGERTDRYGKEIIASLSDELTKESRLEPYPAHKSYLAFNHLQPSHEQ